MSPPTPLQITLTPQAMLYTHALAQMMISLHRLDIPRQLAQQAQDSATLASTLDADPQALQQYLPIAQQLDLIMQDAEGRYQLTESGHCLLPDHPTTLIPALEHAALGYAAWGELAYSVKTGKTAFKKACGADIYDYLAEHPADNIAFNQHMAHTTGAWLTAAASRYPFSGHVIDLGGNQGDFSALLLQQNPDLHSTVFDLPKTVAPATEILATAQVAERSTVIAGNFFSPEQIPTTGTHYLFSRVLLNWPDDQVVQILQNCHQAMPADSTLVILELVQTEETDIGPNIGNLSLLVMFGARIRTQASYTALVTQAGFCEPRWIPASDTMPLYYLEAKPH